MAEEAMKYLPHVPDLHKKRNPIDKIKKLQCVDKQVLNLTGGLFPARIVDPNVQLIVFNTVTQSKQQAGPVELWVRIPILQQNKKLGPIYSWIKQSQKNKLFIGEKFNVPVEVVKPTKQEYAELNKEEWKFEEYKYICQLLSMYNMNFLVVQDRYDFNGQVRTVEEIKEQYYSISSRVLTKRGVKDHPLCNYRYDRKYEENRKFEQEKYLLRNKDKNDEEKNIIEEIRKLDIVIKKEEREQINLKKALKLEEVVNDAEKDFAEMLDVAKLAQIKHPVYTRQQYLSRPLQLPPKVNSKLIEVMQGLNIPDRIIGNKVNQELYDQLRKQILLMFSAQRYIKKKEIEKKTLEDKKKKQAVKDDADPEKKKLANENLKKKMIQTK